MAYRRTRRKYGRRLVRRRRPATRRRRKSGSRVSRRRSRPRRSKATKRTRSIQRTSRKRKAVSAVAKALCLPIRKCVKEMFPKASMYTRTVPGLASRTAGVVETYATGEPAAIPYAIPSAHLLPYAQFGTGVLDTKKSAGIMTCLATANRICQPTASADEIERSGALKSPDKAVAQYTTLNLSQFAFPRLRFDSEATAAKQFVRKSDKANIHIVSNKHTMGICWPALSVAQVYSAGAIEALSKMRVDVIEVVYYFKDRTTMESMLHTDTAAQVTLAQYTNRQHNLLRMYNASFCKHPLPDASVVAPTIATNEDIFLWTSDVPNRFHELAPKRDTGQWLGAGLADLRKQFKVHSRKKRTFKRPSSAWSSARQFNYPTSNASGDTAVHSHDQLFTVGFTKDFKGKQFNFRNQTDTLPRGAYFYCQYARVYADTASDTLFNNADLPRLAVYPMMDATKIPCTQEYAVKPAIEHQFSWAPQFQS